jgi:hypothetical protein
MATTQNTFTGNGSNLGPFSFTFKWLEPTDIKVSVAGVLKTVGTHYNLVGLNYSNKDGGQVAFLPGQAPANGAAIVIYRQTDDSSVSSVFYPGSAIRSQDLNDNFTQGLYVNQEVNNSVAAANTTANTALTNSNTAITTANAATATANTASTNASAAVATANTASTNASAAVSTANIASTNASAAVTTANTASATATTALNTANATAAAQAALEANVYTKAELNAGQLDNRYYTETELNNGQLDNRYYTETEADARFYNVNTESIKSTDVWTNSDGYVATTAAIEARVISLVDQVGGFVPVANHTSFPTSNPDINDNAGTVVSLQSVSGLTHSAGTSTNATTTGSTAVTITGIPASLPSPAGAVGMLVVSTGTLNTYTFHRLTPEVNDVVNVANNATNINTVAGQITPTNNVGTVAGIAASVTTVAGNTANINTVATGIANINTNAANIANINAVAGNNANVTTVAGNTANINTTVANLAAINAAPTQAANAASSAAAALVSQNAASSSAAAAATSASNANTSAVNSASSASAAATSASNALVSEQNADASEALALQYRDDTAGILAQAGSTAFNVTTNQSWGDIISSVVSHFDNEVLADILLSMSLGTQTINYGTII